jgi:hypothetical protein
MSTRASSNRNERITRDDLENRLRAIQGDVSTTAGDAKASAAQIGIAVALLLLLLAFLLGNRRGKRKATIVEIRRF